MPVALHESELNFLLDTSNFSEADQAEVKRQQDILRFAFTSPDYTSDPKKVAILSGLKMQVNAIHRKEKTVDDLLKFQETVYGTLDYAFLEYQHEGFNANGWKIILATADPLRFGRDIHQAVVRRGGGRR